MGLNECHQAAADPDRASFLFVCNEVIGACDAIYSAFPEAPTLRAQVEELSLAMEDLKQAEDLPGPEMRAAVTRVWKSSMAPTVKLLGAPRNWRGFVGVRVSEEKDREQAVRWLFDAWALFPVVPGNAGAPVGALTETRFHR